MNRSDDDPEIGPGTDAGTDTGTDVDTTIVPPSPDEGEPVFAEPWEAQAFGLVNALHERGLFAWEEWSRALSAALDGQDSDASEGDYYRCWLAALEGLLAERDLVPTHELDETSAAWQRAARATPHGMPVLLENDPRFRAQRRTPDRRPAADADGQSARSR